MRCDNLDKCPIYVHRDKERFRKYYADKYCINNCESCERRKIRLEYGMKAVPLTLLPDGRIHDKSIFIVESRWAPEKKVRCLNDMYLNIKKGEIYMIEKEVNPLYVYLKEVPGIVEKTSLELLEEV